jgi:hypothetical protein
MHGGAVRPRQIRRHTVHRMRQGSIRPALRSHHRHPAAPRRLLEMRKRQSAQNHPRYPTRRPPSFRSAYRVRVCSGTGKFLDSEGSLTAVDCLACAANSWAGLGAPTCEICPAGLKRDYTYIVTANRTAEQVRSSNNSMNWLIFTYARDRRYNRSKNATGARHRWWPASATRAPLRRGTTCPSTGGPLHKQIPINISDMLNAADGLFVTSMGMADLLAECPRECTNCPNRDACLGGATRPTFVCNLNRPALSCARQSALSSVYIDLPPCTTHTACV